MVVGTASGVLRAALGRGHRLEPEHPDRYATLRTVPVASFTQSIAGPFDRPQLGLEILDQTELELPHSHLLVSQRQCSLGVVHGVFLRHTSSMVNATGRLKRQRSPS